MKKFISVLFAFLIYFTSTGFSKDEKKPDEEKKDPMSTGTFNGMKFRLIGPAITSGRISDLAINPNCKSEYYVAVASGNVFKTTNSGITFEPIFDNYGSYSIGCVTIDPRNPHVVWIGSGENNSQRSVGWGDGVYKSMDGGKSFKNMGLKKSEHIGKIIVDPRCSNTIFVAAQGPLWAAGGDRGLYKSTDGGETWEQILKISENTGVSDIIYDPRNPDVMYASSYQRRRHVWTLINGGPEAAIYKTTDAGKTWSKLTSGLPSGDVGRIGLEISPINPDIVYALIELPEGKGGFYRSADRGASWSKMSDYSSASAQYYQEMFCDPIVLDKVFLVDTYTKYTEDGGKTFQRLGLKNRHVDDHAFWIDPDNNNHFIIGGDGGIYDSYDGGLNWRFVSNLPVTQFYRIQSDNSEPFYYVYGGTQDNSTWGGPSKTNNSGGITNDDWFQVVGGDGYEPQIDPKDPNIVYGQWQYGNLVRFDRKSGEVVLIQPKEEAGEELRWNWDTPVIISPHSHTRLYIAANKVFKSDDRGNTWTKISPDLTRQIDRNKLPVMGKVWNPEAVAKNASTSLFGNIICLAESPKQAGLLFVGTDDGLIQITEDDGKNWTKIDKFLGVPETTYVSDILPSKHDANVVYATFNNYKNADFKPYVLKSIDKGKTWKSIVGDLPDNGPVWTLVEDHVNPNLLFVGTEFGLYFTNDGGTKWVQLKGGLPTVAVRDLDIQERENDLVVGTFGRGIYILDDYTPLRQITKELLEKEIYVFPIKDALMYNMDDSRAKNATGATFYRADNPPFGATFQFYMKEGYKGKKDQRKEIEKKAEKDKKPYQYPSMDELRSEDDEESAYLLFKIMDNEDNVVRLLTTSAKLGINRITWDMTYPNPQPVTDKTDINKNSGMPVLPGKYKVIVAKSINGDITVISEPINFEAKVLNNGTLPVDRNLVNSFQKKMANLMKAVLGTNELLNETNEKIKTIKNALFSTPVRQKELIENVRAIELKLNELDRKLNGDQSISKRNENQPPSITDRMIYTIWGIWGSYSNPTKTQMDSYTIASKEFTPVHSELKSIIEKDIKELEKKMDELGSPWTPGRIPEWKGE